MLMTLLLLVHVFKLLKWIEKVHITRLAVFIIYHKITSCTLSFTAWVLFFVSFQCALKPTAAHEQLCWRFTPGDGSVYHEHQDDVACHKPFIHFKWQKKSLKKKPWANPHSPTLLISKELPVLENAKNLLSVIPLLKNINVYRLN